MKTAIFAAAFTLFTPAVLGAAHQQRSHTALAAAKRQENCEAAAKQMGEYTVYEPACVNLIYDCLNKVKTSDEMWAEASCVAAATCDGTRNLIQLAQCTNSNVKTDTESAYLKYDIYADIVGSCAWAEGGCPVDQQHYIDFFYSQLSAIGSTEWPASVESVIENYWAPITEWAATGATIPYMNFADWLKFSDSYAVEDATDDCL